MTAALPYRLILLRHGESEWNRTGLFTGWVDVELSEQGDDEAVRGGELLRAARACCPTSCTPPCCAGQSGPRSSPWTSADRRWIPVRRSGG